MDGDATVGVKTKFWFETSVFPGLIKIDYIHDIYPPIDSEHLSPIKDNKLNSNSGKFYELGRTFNGYDSESKTFGHFKLNSNQVSPENNLKQ
jgi:hypothetical protein